MPLTEEQIESCRDVFNQFDKENSGMIDRFELRLVFEQLGHKLSEETLFSMINEIDDSNQGKIEFYEFLRIYERYQESEEDETDMIDAFVAMGGNPDKTGEVDTERLIEIIRKKFEMTIDIERMIDEIDDN
jgi:calmodulin